PSTLPWGGRTCAVMVTDVPSGTDDEEAWTTVAVGGRVARPMSANNSTPCVPSLAARKRRPPTLVKSCGKEPAVPVFRSWLKPAVTPLLVHNSWPWVASLAAKTRMPPNGVRSKNAGERADCSGITATVPGAVPLLFHSAGLVAAL